MQNYIINFLNNFKYSKHNYNCNFVKLCFCVIILLIIKGGNRMTTVITFGNFKGGVGKTTATAMFSYLLSNKNKKVLAIDFDPQANMTNFLFKSFDAPVDKGYITLFEAMKNENLSKATVSLSHTLDIIPSDIDLIAFQELLPNDEKKKHYLLDHVLKDIRNDYDYILIDVPPTISEFTNNALVASDYTLIIMQTEPDSLSGAISFKDYAEGMQTFNTHIKIAGILTYLKKKSSKIDEYILNISLSDNLEIRDIVFNNHIYSRERVKRFRINGITNQDHHDKNVFKMYQKVLNE